jgi:hypothetical protein
MAADDKLEAAAPIGLVRVRAQELQNMAQDALDDQYEATLAQADMHGLQRSTDAAGFAPGITVIDGLDVAGSWLDGNQLLKQQKIGNDWADQMSNCSTAVPSMDLLPLLDD